MKDKAPAPGRLVVKPKSFKSKKEKKPTDGSDDHEHKIASGSGEQTGKKTDDKSAKKKDRLNDDEKPKQQKDKTHEKKDEKKDQTDSTAQTSSKKRKHEEDGKTAQSDHTSAAGKKESAEEHPAKKFAKSKTEAATVPGQKDGPATAPAPANIPQKKRYLLFVGNLPYDTTQEELAAHFKGVGEIAAIRLRDQKGFAFLEFHDPATHVKALKFHHSSLRDRKINVEMTAGGGGNTENRKKKITEKNKKFQDEWAKKIAEKAAQEAQEGEQQVGGDDF